LSIANICSVNTDFEINIAGGRFRHEEHDVLGNSVESFFKSYKTDYGIFGVAGVELDGSLLDFHEEEVRVREQIANNCRESFLVLDYKKFGRIAHIRGGDIREASKVFCDMSPPNEIASLLKESGSDLIVSNKEIAA
jgi:DeoR family glycerol-3-phosphate regulon repressor